MGHIENSPFFHAAKFHHFPEPSRTIQVPARFLFDPPLLSTMSTSDVAAIPDKVTMPDDDDDDDDVFRTPMSGELPPPPSLARGATPTKAEAAAMRAQCEQVTAMRAQCEKTVKHVKKKTKTARKTKATATAGSDAPTPPPAKKVRKPVVRKPRAPRKRKPPNATKSSASSASSSSSPALATSFANLVTSLCTVDRAKLTRTLLGHVVAFGRATTSDFDVAELGSKMGRALVNGSPFEGLKEVMLLINGLHPTTAGGDAMAMHRAMVGASKKALHAKVIQFRDELGALMPMEPAAESVEEEASSGANSETE